MFEIIYPTERELSSFLMNNGLQMVTMGHTTKIITDQLIINVLVERNHMEGTFYVQSVFDGMDTKYIIYKKRL